MLGYRYNYNLNDYDNFWDKYYSKGLRRWENVFPTEIIFINALKRYFLEEFYPDSIDNILRQIYIRLDSKHRGHLFRYKNLYRIYEKLNEMIITPLVNTYTQIKNLDKLIAETNGSSFKSITKTYGSDNTELDEIQKQYFEGANQNEDYDTGKSLYYIKQRTTFLNSLNKYYNLSAKLFMLYTDKKIETGAIDYE